MKNRLLLDGSPGHVQIDRENDNLVEGAKLDLQIVPSNGHLGDHVSLLDGLVHDGVGRCHLDKKEEDEGNR